MSTLESKAMVVKLSTSMWTATATAPDLETFVTSNHDAADGTAKVRKQLIGKDDLKALKASIDGARLLHKSLTLAWSDNGDRLLPVDQLENYKTALQVCIEEVERQRADFVGRYEALVEKARVELGQMFSEDDYPDTDEIAEKIGLQYEILPVPSASHFIADVGTEEADRIKRDIERRTQAKLDAAMVGLYERVETAMRKLVARLGTDDDGNPKPVHKSTLEALKTIAGSIPALNLTEDTKMDEIAERLNRAIGTVDIGDLRCKSKKRSKVEETMKRRDDIHKDLEATLTQYFGTPPQVKPVAYGGNSD